MTHAKATEVFVAGLLHDIGHIGLPDALLGKTVPRMNDAETAQYRKHTVLAEQALMPLEDSQPVIAMIRSHHERHDGRGFPDGLAGDAIPLGASILAVADAFDDLQNGHVIAQGLSQAEASTLIQRGKGTQFQPEVADALLKVLAEMAPRAAPEPVATPTAELLPGLVLASDLRSPEGVMLLAAGQALSADLIRRIRHYEARDGLSLLLAIRPPKRP